MTTEPIDLDAIESCAAWAGSYSTDGVQAAAERFRIAREDVPALIGRVRAAEAERDEARLTAGHAYADGLRDGHRADLPTVQGGGVAVPTLEGFRDALEWLAIREGVRPDWYSEDAAYLHDAFYAAAASATDLTPVHCPSCDGYQSAVMDDGQRSVGVCEGVGSRTVETAEELWGVVLDDFGSTDYYDTREEADEARKRAPDTGLVRVVTTTIVPPTPEEVDR